MRAMLLSGLLMLAACAAPTAITDRHDELDLGGPSLRDVELLDAATGKVSYGGDWHGTGVVVWHAEAAWLLTAAHVVDTGWHSMVPVPYEMHLPVERVTCLGGEWVFARWGLDAHVDVAAYRPVDKYVGPTVTLARLRPRAQARLWCLGYPNGIHALSRGEVLAWDQTGSMVHQDAGSYFGYGGSSGAPVLAYRGGALLLVGIHVAGQTHTPPNGTSLRLPVSFYVPLDAIIALLEREN